MNGGVQISGGRGESAGGPQARQETVLIVDDDPDIVRATRLVLESQGYRVLSAASASEGKKILGDLHPDLVLLDIMMPSGTEGFHFVWDVRQHPDPMVRNVPIIILSAIHRTTDLRLYPEESDEQYGPGEFLPVQGFLDKPVELGELVHTVQSVLGGNPHPLAGDA